jgi:hypothetical protein
MQHDWIFDVLADLQDYARQNGLTDLALKVEEVLETARREIAECRADPALPRRRAH